MTPAERYLHGAPGARTIVVPGTVAVWLSERLNLSALRVRHRGEDAAVDGVLLAITLAAAEARQLGTGGGTAVVAKPEPAPGLHQQVGVSTAADRSGVTPRAIRKAIHDGRLQAQMVDGRWLISTDDLDNYRAA